MAQLVRYVPHQGDNSFDIDPIIERLASLSVDSKSLFQQVRGAADLAAIEDIRGFRPPEAFVVLMVERGKKAVGTRQTMAAAFSVVYAARNYSDQALGKRAADAIKTLKDQARASLVGWIPNRADEAAPGARACEWQQGGVVDYSAGTLIWSDVFTAQQFIGSRAQ